MASRDLNAPNILFILSDDQGAWAMGCAGNEEIVTPKRIVDFDQNVSIQEFCRLVFRIGLGQRKSNIDIVTC